MSRTDIGWTVLQGLRTWVKELASLTDDQVIAGRRAGVRPAMPYITITETSSTRVGPVDEVREREVQTADVDAGGVGDVVSITLDGDELATATWTTGDTASTVAARLVTAAQAAEDTTLQDVSADGATLYLCAPLTSTWAFVGLTDGGLVPTERSWGPKARVFTLTGYGDEAGPLLERLARRAYLSTSIALLDELGLSVEPLTEPAFLADPLDSSMLARFAWDVTVRYDLASEREPITTAESATISTTFAGSSTLTATIDVDLTS